MPNILAYMHGVVAQLNFVRAMCFGCRLAIFSQIAPLPGRITRDTMAKAQWTAFGGTIKYVIFKKVKSGHVVATL